MFVKLFTLAKLPTEMSPSQHRKIQPTTYLGVPGEDAASTAAGASTAGGHHGSTISGGSSPRSIRHRMVSLRRRLSDACGAVAINARRPSIRTDRSTGRIASATRKSPSNQASVHQCSVIRPSIRTDLLTLQQNRRTPVSYTHLTLPTLLRV